MKQGEKLTDKPRFLSELAIAYNVNKKTFKDWLFCETLKDIMNSRKKYYFTISEVKRIVEHLGEP